MLGLAATMSAAPTAKAIYCDANKTLYFTYDDVNYNDSTSYEQLDGKKPTKIYNNISSTGYIDPGGYSSTVNNINNFSISHGNNTPWSKNYRTKITTVKVLPNFIDWKPTSLECYFYGLQKLTSFEGAEYINTTDVTSLQSLFFYCKSLTNFNFLQNWNVSNVTNFYQTFCACGNITDLNFLRNWDVSNATNMSCMFDLCLKLSDISALDNWKNKVKNVKDLSRTFEWCWSITNVDALSEWVFENLKDLSYTFYYDESLSDISGLKKWNVSTVQLMQYTFCYCYSLKNVDDLADWQTGNVVRMDGLLCMGDPVFGDNSLIDIGGLRTWDTTNVIFFDEMLRGCSHLTTVEPIYEWKTDNLGSMANTFRQCSGLTRIDLSKWNLSKFAYEQKYIPWATTTNSYDYFYKNILQYTFRDCTNLIGVTFGTGNVGKEALTRNANALSNTFQNCPKLRFIDFSGCTDDYGNIVSAIRTTNNTMFYSVPRTCVIYLPSGNTEAEASDHENVVYTATDGTLQCDKYYSEDKVDIELPHRFHADVATYERTYSKTYGGVILPYPVKINDNDSDEFQPFKLQEEYDNHMFFKGIDKVEANTPFAFKRKAESTDMKFEMDNVWVESTYDINGETTDNIVTSDPAFSWKSQGFYVNHIITPENGKFNIPTKDDYEAYTHNSEGTIDVAYDYDKVHYISNNRFYRCDNADLTIYPHRILFYGTWQKYTSDPEFNNSLAIEEMGMETAIREAEARMDEERATGIYDANGNQLSGTRRGLNILRMSDGTVKKVIKK